LPVAVREPARHGLIAETLALFRGKKPATRAHRQRFRALQLVRLLRAALTPKCR
jgi:hypothetical protein